MTLNQYIIQRKLSLLELGTTLGNISDACRKMGASRQHYYDIKATLEEEGLEGLIGVVKSCGIVSIQSVWKCPKNPRRNARFRGNRGITELRWKSGLRVYSAERISNLILLLGGNKNGQDKDIRKAKRLLSQIDGA
jgi:hypothetical protein